MGRVKGSKNKVEVLDSGRPVISHAPLDERLKTIANLIIDRILEDQQANLLKANNK